MRAALLTIALLLGLGAARPARAQFLDPDRAWSCWSCYSHNAHATISAGLTLSLRAMPFVKKSWQRPIGRVTIIAIGGALYELQDWGQCAQRHACGHPDAGFGVVDLAYDVAGAVALELVVAGIRRVFR